MERLARLVKTDILFSKGQRLVRQGRLDDALEVFDAVLALNPRHAGALLHRGLALADKGEYDEAVCSIKGAIDNGPSSFAYYLFLGRAYYDAGRLNEALDSLDRVLSLQPDTPVGRSLRSLTRLAIGYDREACEQLSSDIRNTNPEVQGRALLLVESHLGGQGQDPAVFLRDGSDSNDEMSSFVSRVLNRLDRLFEPALRTFFGAAYFGQALYLRARYAGAGATRDARLHQMHGGQRRLYGDMEGAAQEFEAALQLDPELDEAREQLADVRFEMGDYAAAVEHIRQTEAYRRSAPDSDMAGQSVAGKSPHPAMSLMLGIALCRLEEYEDAARYLRFACDSGLKDNLAPYYLGICKLALGDREKAKRWFTEAATRGSIDLIVDRLMALMQSSG